MKVQTREIYRCEYCNKLYLRKSATEAHEKFCHYNPNNDRACFNCIHLEKKDYTICEDYPYGRGEYERNVNLLYCPVVKTFLYPPKVEVKKNWFETDPIPNNSMPKECADHQSDLNF